MSGGDLDGDGYMIIWDKELVEGMTVEHEPAKNVKTSSNEIKTDDPVDHIIYYY
jgi:hypothetical protein